MKKIWDSFLTFLAICFLLAFSYPAFVSEISKDTQTYLDLIQWTCWLAFALDLLINLFRTKNKKSYITSHPLEILAVALPFLRPLRILRLLSFSSLILNKVSMGRSVGISVKVALTSLFLAYIAGIQITIIEKPLANSNIKSIEDGLWWALTTVTTVGYGDRYPVSTEGRFIAFFLMVLGISLLGVMTATVAAWFVKMSEDSEDH